MKLFVKFDFNALCNIVLKEQLQKIDTEHRVVGFGEVEFIQKLTQEKKEILANHLSNYDIEIVEDQKVILVEKIKETIVDMVYNNDVEVNVKSSVYLSEKLGHSYGYLANLFSEVTYSSIENYIILQKIEYTKHLIINQDLSLTEIAFKLGYSSVAHLSTQFKNTTGLTPTAFSRIIEKRKDNNIG